MIGIDSKISKSKEIDATDLNGEKVMMNIEKGIYYSLNEVGSRIWELMKKDITVQEIINILLMEYEIDNDTCEKAVLSYLKDMEDAELIKVI